MSQQNSQNKIENRLLGDKCKIVCVIVFLAVVILYQAVVNTYNGDDRVYAEVWGSVDILTWLSERYATWTSRIIIDFCIAFFVKYITLWRVINVFVYCLLAYSLYKLSDKTSLFAVLALILMYPLKDLCSAGWVATHLNYIWPLAFGMYAVMTVREAFTAEKPCVWRFALGIPAAIFAANVEQWCAVYLGILVLYTIAMVFERNFRRLWALIIHYVIAIGSLLFILRCPGNDVRMAQEVTDYMPGFYDKSVIDKLIDGFTTTMSRLISSYNIIFLVLAAVLMFIVIKKTKGALPRIIGIFPFAVSLVVAIGQSAEYGFFGTIANRITNNIGPNAANWNWLSAYMASFVYCLAAFCVLVSLLLAYDDLKRGLAACYIFAVAIASSVVLGFSPTLFVSENRTMIFCCFLIVLLILLLIRDFKGEFSEKELSAGKYTAAAAAILVSLNNLCV